MTDRELDVLRYALRWGLRPNYAANPGWMEGRRPVYCRFLEEVLTHWQRGVMHAVDLAGAPAATLLIIQDAEIRALPEYRLLLAEFSL